jgi:hypothetical protein
VKIDLVIFFLATVIIAYCVPLAALATCSSNSIREFPLSVQKADSSSPALNSDKSCIELLDLDASTCIMSF